MPILPCRAASSTAGVTARHLEPGGAGLMTDRRGVSGLSETLQHEGLAGRQDTDAFRIYDPVR